MICIVLAIIMS